MKPGVVHSEFRPFGQNSVQFTLEALEPQRFIEELGIVVVNIAVELRPVVDTVDGKGAVVVDGAKVDITVVVDVPTCTCVVDVDVGDMVPPLVVDTFVGKITEVRPEEFEGVGTILLVGIE